MNDQIREAARETAINVTRAMIASLQRVLEANAVASSTQGVVREEIKRLETLGSLLALPVPGGGPDSGPPTLLRDQVK